MFYGKEGREEKDREEEVSRVMGGSNLEAPGGWGWVCEVGRHGGWGRKEDFRVTPLHEGWLGGAAQQERAWLGQQLTLVEWRGCLVSGRCFVSLTCLPVQLTASPSCPPTPHIFGLVCPFPNWEDRGSARAGMSPRSHTQSQTWAPHFSL